VVRRHLSFILEGAGEGSLLTALKLRGWAEAVGLHFSHARDFTVLDFSVSLTPAGLQLQRNRAVQGFGMPRGAKWAVHVKGKKGCESQEFKNDSVLLLLLLFCRMRRFPSRSTTGFVVRCTRFPLSAMDSPMQGKTPERGSPSDIFRLKDMLKNKIFDIFLKSVNI
jgi:hypothetical protein